MNEFTKKPNHSQSVKKNVVAISTTPQKLISKECDNELDNSFSTESENEYIDKELKMSFSVDSENEYIDKELKMPFSVDSENEYADDSDDEKYGVINPKEA